MRTRTLSLLIIVCFFISALAVIPTNGQSPALLQSNEQLNISKLRCWQEAPGVAMSSAGGWGATNVNPNRWKVEFHLKSVFDKPAAVLYWSFRFVNKDGKSVVQDFKNKREIKPGKDTLIAESFDYPSNQMPKDMMGNIIIRRVEFADGSSWQPKPDESDPMLTKSPQ